MSPMLDLSGAEEMSFEAVPAGRYSCTVFDIATGETEAKEGAKLPDGTLYYNVQFRVADGEEYENRRFFNRYHLPESSYEKAAILQGMFVSFLKACGYEEEEIKSGSFEFDPDDVIGKELLVTVGRTPKKDSTGAVVEGEFNNPVKSVRAPIDGEESEGGLL